MILAVDPGLATCGWAIVTPHTARVVAVGVLTSDHDPLVDEWTDRVQRVSRQAAKLAEVAKLYSARSIAAEAISCGGPPSARFSMGTSLCLSWGVLAGIACTLRIDLAEVAPKMWQHAVCPGVEKIDYGEVFKLLSTFVESHAAKSLWSIRPGLRNHALDAVGVGVYAALRDVTRISQPTEATA